MSTLRPKLQIVPYQPDNYSGAEVLALENATLISSQQSISAAMSLYFEWEKKRFSQIIFKQGTHQKPIECTMSYDQDEASPTEIRVKLHKHLKSLDVVPGGQIVMRFEIFRVTYEFSVLVTAVAGDAKKEGWHVVIEVPQVLKVLKSRRLPRLRLTKEAREVLGSAIWIKSDGEKLDLELLEIGLGTVRAKCKNLKDEKLGAFTLGEVTVPGEVLRSAEGEIIFSLKFETSEIFGAYFDEYRRVAYPSLRSRYDFPYEVGIDLYESAGYFETFDSAVTQEEKQEIMNTWNSIKTGFHKTNADYYVTNEDSPIGCSGLALTNYVSGLSLWTFHQLCALKNPNLILESGVLYSWRSEYLAARPEQLAADASYRSKSRWLERIYTKHSKNSTAGSKLSAVLQSRCTFAKPSQEAAMKTEFYSIGHAQRLITVSEEFSAAVNPKYLNASANLDMIIALSGRVTPEKLKIIGGQLATKLEMENVSMVVVVPMETDLSEFEGVKGKSDRYCYLPKEDLVNLMSSIEHSMAITERKLHNASVE
jgi:hypothetical protein